MSDSSAGSSHGALRMTGSRCSMRALSAQRSTMASMFASARLIRLRRR
jgi:hypothetical protein